MRATLGDPAGIVDDGGVFAGVCSVQRECRVRRGRVDCAGGAAVVGSEVAPRLIATG